MARIESALDTFNRFRLFLPPNSGNVRSDPESDVLPWLDEVLCGERMSLVTGDGGTELALSGNSTDKLKADAVYPLLVSWSDPELISADTLLRRRAKVTFFSSLGSAVSAV